jgi:hypothetical protein
VKDKVDNGIILSWVGGVVMTEAQYQHLEQTQWNNVHSHDPSGITMPLPPPPFKKWQEKNSELNFSTDILRTIL